MKDKLLELIGLELKDLSNLKFHDTDNWYNDGNPARSEKHVIRRETGCAAKFEDWHELKFTLKFPDGKPDVQVYTSIDCTVIEEIVKIPWWKRSQFKHTIDTFTYDISYIVQCGELLYTLTDDEATNLYTDVNTTFKEMVKYDIKAKETKTINKINARIARHTKKDDNNIKLL